MNKAPVNAAIIGAGMISHAYLANLRTCPDVSVVCVADLDPSRAAAVAGEHGVDHCGAPASALARDDVEIVINLTTPAAHAEVTQAALEADKHVYSEKPLAISLDDGRRLMAAAAERNLRIGCAPDTVLGAGIQSAVRAIDGGVIGTPVAAATASQSFGPESWHPNPEFFFQAGAGPLFDIGPYYLSALVAMLGSAQRVAASARQARQERVIGSGPKAGTRFPVEVPTHVNALIEFESGVSAASTFSFDSTLQRRMIEVVGTEGTLSVPDPNQFDGAVRVMRAGEDAWSDRPVQGSSLGRGIGVVDLAQAIRAGREHRASGHTALHVLELMTAIIESADSGQFRAVNSRVDRPEPLAPEWDPQQSALR
jgi:predicted dehydrogenase